MSKKSNPRISVNTFERAAEDYFATEIIESWRGIEVIIKPTLPLKEMMTMCAEIVDACFTQGGDFMPETMDFAVRSGVLTHYANFTMPGNIEKHYMLACGTDAFDFVLEYINRRQLDEIVSSAAKKIRALCDSDIRAARAKMNELTETLSAPPALSEDDMRLLLGAIGKTGSLDERALVEAYLKQGGEKQADSGEGGQP